MGRRLNRVPRLASVMGIRRSSIQVVGLGVGASNSYPATPGASLNGESSAKEATTLFFRTGLNNGVPHTLKITNEGNSSLSIGSINVTTASSQS